MHFFISTLLYVEVAGDMEQYGNDLGIDAIDAIEGNLEPTFRLTPNDACLEYPGRD